MKRNTRDPGKSRKSVLAFFQRSREKTRTRARAPYIIAGILVFSLLLISGIGSFVGVKNAHATSDCGILFACPSPTPSPTLSPTPSPTPTKKPTPTPTTQPTPTPTPRPTPTATATAAPSPTATLPAPTATPIISPTSVPAATRGNPGQRTPGQSGGDMPVMAVVVAGISLCLLISLAIGWFIFRRALLPTIEMKLPPSGARPWSRTRVPNPGSQGGIVNAESGQAMINPATATNNGFAPGTGGFGASNNYFAPPGGPGTNLQQGFGSTAYNNWPDSYGPGGGSSERFMPPPYPGQG